MSLVKWNNNLLLPNFTSFMDDFFDETNLNPSLSKFQTLPATNIEETDKAFVLKMAIPGMDKKDIKIEMDKNLLIVSAEKETKEEENDKFYARKEYNFSSFKRSFLIPENVKKESIDAKCMKGELQVTMPKLEVEISKPKQIAVG